MDQIAVTNLEAELGCFDGELSDNAPRRDHGDPSNLFDIPATSTSRLDPPSKTRSVYPFGTGGTLAWTTPAGELLQVANLVDNRLISADYKRSIERGRDYRDRGKVLERALDSPQGSGFGIGISLGLELEPLQRSWAYNRWPRFGFQHNGLELNLQYYIDADSQAVIQEYQIRNTGQEEVSLPYIISSDLCFREHRGQSSVIHSLNPGKCSERLLLFQNTELRIQNDVERCQLRMALFLNARRHSLWAESGSKVESNKERVRKGSFDPNTELKEADDRLRDRILAGQFADEDADSELRRLYRRCLDRNHERVRQSTPRDLAIFAIHRQSLIVPPGSTQELRLVIQLSGSLHKANELADPSSALLVPKEDRENHGKGHGDKGSESNLEKIRSKQRLLIANTQQISPKTPDLEGKRRISRIVNDHLDLGQACAVLDLLAEARYHLIMACYLSEYLYREGSLALSNARFTYAKFLHSRGWNLEALDILKRLSVALSKRRSSAKELSIIREKVQMRIALVYLESGSFAEAEEIYEKALPVTDAEGTLFKPVFARCLERLAWAQVKQGKYGPARISYLRLLELPKIPRQVVFSNLGFIERKLRRDEAKGLFIRALDEIGPGHAIDQLYARSGLYATLHQSGQNPEDHPEIAGSLVRPFSAMALLLQSHSKTLATLFREPPFQFAIMRHLESLLSSCSIPVRTENGPHGIAFVDADPLGCLHEGRVSYFQFKFLTQCQKYIEARDQPKEPSHDSQQEEASRQETSERIRATCHGHLVWVFKIASFSDTWGIWYTAGGALIDENVAVEDPSISHAIEGAYHFSKLWLYLQTWKTEWQFVLGLLHSRLSDWLDYLVQSQHLGNLWVERHGYEALRPYDTISPDYASIFSLFPQYHLSDFTMLWLTLRQLHHLIDSIGDEDDLQARAEGDSSRDMFNEVRRAFDDSRKLIGSQTIRSNILKTFVVGDTSYESSIDKKAMNNNEANGANNIQTTVSLSPSEKFPHSEFPASEGEGRSRSLQTRTPARQIVAFRRTVNEYSFGIQSPDIAIIEAAISGFFECSDQQVSSAWQENLKLQLDHHIPALENPPQVALTLFAAKFRYILANSIAEEVEEACLVRLNMALYDSGLFAQTIVGNAPESMRSWSGLTYETLSIVIGGLFPECRASLPSQVIRTDEKPLQDLQLRHPLDGRTSNRQKRKKTVMIPQQGAASSKPARRNIVDSTFLPEWMYHYPVYLHKNRLEIDVEEDLKRVDGVGGFKVAIKKWKSRKGFSSVREYPAIFPPHVADSGTKKGAGLNGDSIQRQMSVEWYGTTASFYDCLVRPRTFDQAKKRLVELGSHNQEAVLICWLTAPEQEKPLFLEFLRRHGSSESFFGERVDWTGNIWETELHLGFHQLLSEEDNKRFRPLHLDYHSQLRIRKMPSLSQASHGSEITPVAVSLRFVGDLRDRSWTCHFLSSAARDDGFTGIVDEFTDSKSSEITTEELYLEKIGQRKVLEMTYVERILSEMGQSCEEILAGFQRELDVPETRDPQSESYEFIDNYSRLHSKAGEILRDVFKQLDVAVRTIEEWEKREDTRELQSRWSEKDEERYGRKLKDLSRKCKVGVQQLRRNKDRLEEQQKLAEQRHNNLINYMSLQAARTSSRSAEDVRLFTYVTIIFLPLSFSSSLFSMQGAPQGSLLQIMVPTTVIALAVTIFVLANMKVLDRNWRFWMYKINASARRKMELTKHSWGPSWNRISRELAEAAQLRQAKPEDEKHLPAQSGWWYFWFWLSYCLSLPRLYVLEGFQIWENRKNQTVNHAEFLTRILLSVLFTPTCIFIFMAQLAIVSSVDLLVLLWKSMRRLKRTMLPPPANKQSPNKGHEKMMGKSILNREADTTGTVGDEDLDRRRFSILSTDSSIASKKGAITFHNISSWLRAPPRPIKDFTTRNLDVLDGDPGGPEVEIPDDDLKDGPIFHIIHSDEFRTDEDKWEIAMENTAAAQEETTKRNSPDGGPLQRKPSDESYRERPSTWRRWNKKIQKWQKPETEV